MSLFFGKSQRLCSRTLIDSLYASGHRLMAYPYSIHWQEAQIDVPCQVLITTSKRKFHHAVDRNRIKRMTRECYRMHLPQLQSFLTAQGLCITLSLNYIHTTLPEHDYLQRKFDKMMAALEQSITQQTGR